MTIEILDPIVAQQIAAGEVVDRPASVVKELIENALDAGATRVEVDIADGGTSKIMVRDGGRGMDREDAARSVLRHATSKIREASDIEELRTLGFRGEALPSIASVSLLELTTSTSSDSAGTKVVVDGGAEPVVSSASHPRGTTILVNMLFYNVPARRAFLKGKRVERAAIVDVLTHLVVANPEVGFKLTEGAGELLSFAQAKNLSERMAQVFGMGKARAMRPVSLTSGPFKVEGLVSLPSVTYSSRSSCQTVSINGRYASAESVNRGLDDGYRGTIPAGRYAPVALSIHVDPRQVDVNVHPTKQLMRFSNEKGIRQALSDAVKLAIGLGAHHDERHSSPSPSSPSSSVNGLGKAEAQNAPAPEKTNGPSDVAAPPSASPAHRSSDKGAAPGRAGRRQPDDLFGSGNGSTPREVEKPENLRQAHKRMRDVSQPAADIPPSEPDRSARPTEELGDSVSPQRGSLPSLEDLRVIGQAGLGYILAEQAAAVWVIDQHAAHERTILDRLKDPETPPTVQPLLVPTVVELSEQEAAVLSEALGELAVYGFEAQMFGPRSVRITSVVSTLADRDVSGAFSQALRVVEGTEPGMSREERLLATVACHSAVKVGDRLTLPEMERLVGDWLGSKRPATCPHGRSICYPMPLREMARKLDRR